VKKRLGLVAILVLSLLILDQVVKIWVKTSFSSDEVRYVFGNWFALHYIENQGMAFGTTFGSSVWHKLALSIFRIIAIGFIIYYIIREARKVEIRTEYLMAVGLILAGATGNLIDSMFYDLYFNFDPCMPYNGMEGSGIFADCYGFKREVRNTGFLMGNVVDMFKFQANWPIWVPWIGGSEVFPAIWNLADASISAGVILIFIRQKAYFKESKTKTN
jgi:signal peptidase II